MTMDQDVFFREWRARRDGERRSLERARLLAGRLGIDVPAVPVLGVVGSKGKGTTATYASATLAAAGLRVVTVTGPSFRSNRERIRVDGAALPSLADLGKRLDAAMAGLPGPGYLAPSGLFTLAAVLHAHEISADALVIEAGMGGASDELSLFAPTVVAIASVFGEHLGKLGDTVPEIAREKAGVTAPATRAVLSLPQAPGVRAAIAETVRPVEVTTVDPDRSPTDRLPEGLSRQNGALGCAAGLRLIEELGRPAPALDATLATVRLPARLSRHRIPGTDARITVDSAIERRGVATALAAAGPVDHVFVCLPDHKDVDGAIAALDGRAVTAVRLPDAHLRFDHALPAAWDVMEATDVTAAALAARGGRLLALGTVYFTGRVLDAIDADTERLFTPPAGSPAATPDG